MDRVKVLRDIKVQGLGNGLISWLNSLVRDDWPVEGVGDASEAFWIERRNLIGIGEVGAETLERQVGQHFLSSNHVSLFHPLKFHGFKI